MNNLKVFFVVMAIHRTKEWIGYAGYIFATDQLEAIKFLAAEYGEVNVVSIEEVPVQPGTILYGERWKTINAKE